jgi:hypothetical protein
MRCRHRSRVYPRSALKCAQVGQARLAWTVTVRGGPGSAVHRYASAPRCTASGTRGVRRAPRVSLAPRSGRGCRAAISTFTRVFDALMAARRVRGKRRTIRRLELDLHREFAPHPARAFGARHPLPASRGEGFAACGGKAAGGGNRHRHHSLELIGAGCSRKDAVRANAGRPFGCRQEGMARHRRYWGVARGGWQS